MPRFAPKSQSRKVTQSKSSFYVKYIKSGQRYLQKVYHIIRGTLLCWNICAVLLRNPWKASENKHFYCEHCSRYNILKPVENSIFSSSRRRPGTVVRSQEIQCWDAEYWWTVYLETDNWDVESDAAGTAPAWEPHGRRGNAVLQGFARGFSVRVHLACCRAIAIANGWQGISKQRNLSKLYVSPDHFSTPRLPQYSTRSAKNNCRSDRTKYRATNDIIKNLYQHF